MNSQTPARPPLDTSRLRDLGHRPLAEVVAESPSTNAVLADRARSGAAEGTVLVAEHQTAGRGRLGRGWATPARSALTFSVLLRPRVPAGRWPWLPLLTGCAVAATLRDAGVAAGLKWPNDVLVDGRKLCGILLERVETPTGPAAVLGIGLNTSLTAEELPETGTSVWLETGEEPDRTALLVDLLTRLLEEYDAWQAAADDGALRRQYVDRCVTLGLGVRVERPGAEPLAGRAVDVDAEGRLVVDSAEGRSAVGAGDVVHVRPASGGWPAGGEVT